MLSNNLFNCGRNTYSPSTWTGKSVESQERTSVQCNLSPSGTINRSIDRSVDLFQAEVASDSSHAGEIVDRVVSGRRCRKAHSFMSYLIRDRSLRRLVYAIVPFSMLRRLLFAFRTSLSFVHTREWLSGGIPVAYSSLLHPPLIDTSLLQLRFRR